MIKGSPCHAFAVSWITDLFRWHMWMRGVGDSAGVENRSKRQAVRDKRGHVSWGLTWALKNKEKITRVRYTLGCIYRNLF